jgi:hypothetical protein
LGQIDPAAAGGGEFRVRVKYRGLVFKKRRAPAIVRIEERHVGRDGVRKPPVSGGSWTRILLVNKTQPRIWEVAYDLVTSIGGSVVNNDNFEIRERLASNRLQRSFNVRRFVI